MDRGRHHNAAPRWVGLGTMADKAGRHRASRWGQFTVGAKALSKGATPIAADRLMTGRIVGLSYGHGTGFIRAAEGQRVYFHRSDISGGSFDALEVGDAVTFDMVEDRLSGLRGLRIRKGHP
jgi:cold shock CspA family protein